MKFASDQALRAARNCGIAMLLIAALSPLSAFAQSLRARDRGFWVAESADVTVPADEGIVIMLIRTVAPVPAMRLRKTIRPRSGLPKR